MNKKVNLILEDMPMTPDLVLGNFAWQAKQEGWSNVDIDDVISKAKEGSFNNLLRVILYHCV